MAPIFYMYIFPTKHLGELGNVNGAADGNETYVFRSPQTTMMLIPYQVLVSNQKKIKQHLCSTRNQDRVT